MSVVHISEEEAARDLHSVLKRFDQGESIVIERPGQASVTLELTPVRRTFAQAIAMLKEMPGERIVIDEDFSRDIQLAHEAHRNDYLESSKWD